MQEKFNNQEVSDQNEPQGLTEEEIERIIEESRDAVLPFYDEIEKLRMANPKREVGGRIVKGKMQLFDVSRWEKDGVVGESYEEERRLAEEGVLSFHSHPAGSSPRESGQDILTAYCRFREVIFHDGGVTLLIALTRLSAERIEEINKQEWQQAQEDDEKYGNDAFGCWQASLRKKLPLRVVKIVDKK